MLSLGHGATIEEGRLKTQVTDRVSRPFDREAPRASVRVKRASATALLLLTLLGVTSCDESPASPTSCEASCSQASNMCLWLGSPGGNPPTGCDWAYTECIAKCR